MAVKEMPVIGLGTWRLRDAGVEPAVHAALDAGYRHIDTAAMYGNEAEVGDAIRSHPTAREEIFVTTKVWPGEIEAGRLQQSAEESLKRLQLDQVDLLLIHWPSPSMPLKEQIGQLCRAKRSGLARHIGVSNFPPLYVEAAVRHADEPILTNQVERHPYLDQGALAETCARHGISVTAYAPLGRTELLRDPIIGGIAKAHGRTPAQIVLRWQIQLPNNIAIPKSGDPGRIAENIDIFDFALSEEEMDRISALRRPNGRMINASVPLDWNGSPP